MINIKQKLGCICLAFGLTLSVSTGANAQILTLDVVRTVQFAVQSIQRMQELLTEYQKVFTKMKELEIWEKKTAITKVPESFSYEFMAGKSDAAGSFNPFQMGSEEYMPAEGDAEAAEKYIKENFFFDEDISKVTEEKKKEVMKRRHEYVEALAKEVMSLSEAIREQIASEQKRLSEAQTDTGSVIQQLDLLSQNKKIMVEQKAGDILLQAKLFELEAAQMLFSLSTQLIEDPEKKKDENK